MRRSTSHELEMALQRAQFKDLPSTKLRTLLWLHQGIHVCGSVECFRQVIYAGKGDSKLVEKWIRGKSHPRSDTAARLDESVAGLFPVFRLAELLRNRPLSAESIEKIMAPFRTDATGEDVWVFPNDDTHRVDGRFKSHFDREDTRAFVERGDMYGFLAIVAAVRMEEADGDGRDYRRFCADMYRAIPAILKIPWVAPARALLEQCVDAIRFRYAYSATTLSVDWNVIERQAADAAFEPNRELRKRDPETGRFVELEDPVVYCGIYIRTRSFSRG